MLATYTILYIILFGCTLLLLAETHTGRGSFIIPGWKAFLCALLWPVFWVYFIVVCLYQVFTHEGK